MRVKPTSQSSGATTLHETVPTQDVATDVYMRDVIGKKSDTVAGTSIVSLIRGLVSAIGVPGIDGVLDIWMRDVLGNKSDTVAGTSLVALVKTAIAALEGSVDAANRVAGKMQSKAVTIDLAQAANTYDLFLVTAQPVILEALLFALPNIDVSDDATITSISIHTNDATPVVLVSAAAGAKANLTAEHQLASRSPVYLAVGKKIQLTIAGGAADVATVCNVVALARAVVNGGYLA